MRRPADFKHFNLSQSEHTMIKKWSRLIVAVYVTLAAVGVAATLVTGSTCPPTSSTR